MSLNDGVHHKQLLAQLFRNASLQNKREVLLPNLKLFMTKPNLIFVYFIP
jgi:hypothetical protein